MPFQGPYDSDLSKLDDAVSDHSGVRWMVAIAACLAMLVLACAI